MTDKKKNAGKGLGLTAVALAAVAGSYYIYNKLDPKRKKKIETWTLRMKADVLDKLEGMKDVSKEAYEEVVDAVSAKYERLKDIDTNELKSLGKDLKKHWGGIQKSVKSHTSKVFKK